MRVDREFLSRAARTRNGLLMFRVLAYLVRASARTGPLPYGYGIARWLNADRKKDPVCLQAVYKALSTIEKRHWAVRTEGEPDDRLAGSKRAYYEITPLGRDAFRAWADVVENYCHELVKAVDEGRDGLRVKRDDSG